MLFLLWAFNIYKVCVYTSYSTFFCLCRFVETVSKEGEDVVSAVRMKDILKNSQLDGLLDGKLSAYKAENVSAVWCEEKQMEGVEIPDGSAVRLRTKGNSCCLGMFTCDIAEIFSSYLHYYQYYLLTT